MTGLRDNRIFCRVVRGRRWVTGRVRLVRRLEARRFAVPRLRDGILVDIPYFFVLGASLQADILGQFERRFM